MPALATTPPTFSPPDGYHALSKTLLALSDRALADYYHLPDGAVTPQLLCSRARTPSAEALTRLAEGGHGRVLVHEREFPSLCERLVGATGEVLTDTRLSQAERFSMLLAARSSQADLAQRLIKPTRLITHAKRVAEDICDIMNAGRVAPEQLFHAPRVGSNWLIHGANVAAYSVLLAIATGVQDKEELRRLAMAAMLHDLGLRLEGGKEHAGLSREEKREYYGSHPQRGFEELIDDSDFDRWQLMIVYQHHESPDGSGFPVGVSDEEVSRWAKLVKVVDAFDELTTGDQPCRKAPAENAFRQLREKAGAEFDTELVRCWTQVMSKA